MFRISRRKRRGMSVIASATSRSNRSLFTCFLGGPEGPPLLPFATCGANLYGSRRRARLKGSPHRCLLHKVLVIIAVVANGTLVAERLRLTNATAVKNLDVRREDPHFLRQLGAQLFLDFHR